MKHYKPKNEDKPKSKGPDVGKVHHTSHTSSNKQSEAKPLNKKAIIIAIIFIIGFILGMWLTNASLKAINSSQSEQLASHKATNVNLQANLKDREERIAQLQESINQQEEQYNVTKINLDITEEALVQEKQTNQDLESANDDLLNDVAVLEDDVEDAYEIVESSVSAVCCSFQDAQQATILNWRIRNGEIDCSDGDSTVNCQSGETEFVN